MNDWRLGFSYALLTAVMWGLLPLALKGVMVAMDPVTISWYRFALSALIALLWYGWASGGALRALLAPGQRGWTLMAVLGLLGNYLLYIWGLELVNAGVAQILIQLAPLLLLLSGVLLFGEHLYPLQWLGVATFTGGMLLFFRQRLGGDLPTGGDYAVGALLIIAAAVWWTAYGVAQKRLLLRHHAKHILLLICLAGTVVLLPLSAPLQVRALDGNQLWLLLFCGINTIVAYGAFGLALSYWEATRVSAVIAIAPLFTLLFTWLLNRFGGTSLAAEPMDWSVLLGAALVVGGSAATALARRGAPAATAAASPSPARSQEPADQ